MTVPPPLATTQQLKDLLRITNVKEDDLIADLIAEAIGVIETSVGKCLTTESAVWYDDVNSFVAYRSPNALILRYCPIDPATVVVTDNSAVVVNASNYVVRQDLQQILGATGQPRWDGTYGFDNGPYTIACTAGFGTSPTYLTRELPNIRRLILSYASFLYQQRTPGAVAENAAGSRVQYEVDDETGYPKVVARGIRKLRGIVLAP